VGGPAWVHCGRHAGDRPAPWCALDPRRPLRALRPTSPDRRRVALKALRGAGHEQEMRRALQAAMAAFLFHRGAAVPTVDEDMLHQLAVVADFVTRARSGVVREGYRRDLQYTPEPESPTRFAKVLLSLARGIAVAHDSTAVTARELRLVCRVALDCLRRSGGGSCSGCWRRGSRPRRRPSRAAPGRRRRRRGAPWRTWRPPRCRDLPEGDARQVARAHVEPGTRLVRGAQDTSRGRAVPLPGRIGKATSGRGGVVFPKCPGRDATPPGQAGRVRIERHGRDH
jgi:hypothetical protein